MHEDRKLVVFKTYVFLISLVKPNSHFSSKHMLIYWIPVLWRVL